jgi:predicted protein tyrosine phosphatase
MWKYISASGKVLYDKTVDYLTYYTGLTENDSESGEDDTIMDYDDILKIELYEDENYNIRIFPVSTYYNEYSTFYSEPTYIIDNIYLGSAFNAASYETLKELNITLIINATVEISNYFPDEFSYIRYKLYDNNKHSIKKYLSEAYKDIKEYQKNREGNILIHCFMGASRSASIVLYYIMKTLKHENGTSYSFDDALQYLREKRCIVNPTFRLTKDLASSVKLID